MRTLAQMTGYRYVQVAHLFLRCGNVDETLAITAYAYANRYDNLMEAYAEKYCKVQPEAKEVNGESFLND